MKKKFYSIILLVIIFNLVISLIVVASSVEALGNDVSVKLQQTATTIPVSNTNTPVLGLDASNTLGFKTLGKQDILLSGPYASSGFSFSLPPNWRLLDGSEIHLFISAFTAGNTTTQGVSQIIGATLDVYFNNNFVTTILLEPSTNREYVIRIPVDALTPVNGNSSLFLSLNAGADCELESHKTTVVIHSNSNFVLPHVESSIPLNLGNLPSPIYQRDSIIPSQVAIIVPKSPSSEELRSALITSAGLGRMTNGRLSVTLINIDQLTEAIRKEYFLIFVGKALSFSFLSTFTWPTSIALNGQFYTEGLGDEDGIIQMITSPWNSARTVIWVGGNSDIGIVKAAQALATGSIKPLLATQQNQAIVANIVSHNITSSEVSSTDRTFSDLGYNIETISGSGGQVISYEFYVPAGFAPSENPYVDLSYNYSSLLDSTLSSLTMFVNGIEISSEDFNDETASLVTKRFTISKNLIQTGINQIQFEINLTPLSLCISDDLNNLWVNIFPDSVLHLPLIPVPTMFSIFNSFSDYPEALTNNPTLENIAFSISKDDPNAWAVASILAYNLGLQAKGSILEFSTYYDEEIPEESRGNYDWILIGLPSKLPSLDILKNIMPIPFEEGDALTLVLGDTLLYRVPSNTSLGYLELLPSPWGEGHIIIAVLGSNAEGLEWAGNSLVIPKLRGSLFGNFAVVSGENVIAADTLTGTGISQIVSSIPPDTSPQVIQQPLNNAPAGEPSTLEKLLTRKDYIPFLTLLLFVLLIGIFFWVFYFLRRKA